MMKSGTTALLFIISFLLIPCRSSGRLLMKNNLFIPLDSLSAFDLNLNSFADDESHMEKDAVDCMQEIVKPRSTSSSLSPRVQKTDKFPSSVSNKAKSVFKSLSKGKVPSAGPNPIVNSMVTEHRLFTSMHSHGVGEMQMIRPKSPAIRVQILKSDHSDEDDQVQQEKSNKRMLAGSNPSPGDGN